MKKINRFVAISLSILFVLSAVVFVPAKSAGVSCAAGSDSVGVFRLYNRSSGEHFYTYSQAERDNLIRAGWKGEGYGWMAPSYSNTPVYRLYNPNAGDHHYTTNAAERDMLVLNGWSYECISWYSDDAGSVPVYRQYNPNATTGAHNYTTNAGEAVSLINAGWHDESVGWYGTSDPYPEYPAEPEVQNDGSSDITARMLALKAQYPEGMPWTNDNYYTSKALLYQEGRDYGVHMTGAGCAGFALILGDAAFGEFPMYEKTSFDTIHVGDIIRIGGYHSVIVTEINGDTLTIAEGNYNSSIHWGRKLSMKDKGDWTYIWTRYK